MTPEEHYRKAEQLLEQGTKNGMLPNHIAAAQVHATLATVQLPETQTRPGRLGTCGKPREAIDQWHHYAREVENAYREGVWPPLPPDEALAEEILRTRAGVGDPPPPPSAV